MKIVQINNTYDYGSTGKITRDIHEYLLAQGYDSYVLYGRRQPSTSKYVVKTCTEFEAKANNLISRVTGRPYAVSPVGTGKLIYELERLKPDVVHLQCINGYFVNIYHLLSYLKKHHIPTVLTLHAEFMYTGNCGYAFECENWKTGCVNCPSPRKAVGTRVLDQTHRNWEDMREAFKGFEALQICAVSDWVKERASQSPILDGYDICTVFNGIDTDVFHYDKRSAEEVRNQLNAIDKKIVLHVTANYQNPVKGGNYVTQLSQMLDPDKYVVVVIDGNGNPPPADFRGVYVGRAASQEKLAAYYSAADVTVVTSKRETFSMICAESLCCGTPVIGFKAGAPERISIKDFSKFFEYGNIQQVLLGIQKVIAVEETLKRKISLQSIDKYSKEQMAKTYLHKYIHLVKELRSGTR